MDQVTRMRISKLLLSLGLLISTAAWAQQEQDDPPTLQSLSDEFWAWRQRQQPIDHEPLSRLQRPDGWVPAFSPEAIVEYQYDIRRFKRTLEGLNPDDMEVAARVDLQLLQSAMERVHWELEVLRSPFRNPGFYVDQALGSLTELLVIPAALTETRRENLLIRLEHIPSILGWAPLNLTSPVRPFARTALLELVDIEQRLPAMTAALKNDFPEQQHQRLNKATSGAVSAFLEYRSWLETNLETMQTAFAIGPIAYQWYLSHVALVPHTPGDLLDDSQRTWKRLVAGEMIEHNRNRQVSDPTPPDNVANYIRAAGIKEQELRQFLVSRGLLSVPEDMQPFQLSLTPTGLADLVGAELALDLGSPSRPEAGATLFLGAPAELTGAPNLLLEPDARLTIIRNGIPGLYFQRTLSWNQPDPVRRQFYDATANRGIAAYLQQVLLQSGLFEFSPKSREAVGAWMKLQSLRAQLDIQLASGEVSLDQAVEWLTAKASLTPALAYSTNW